MAYGAETPEPKERPHLAKVQSSPPSLCFADPTYHSFLATLLRSFLGYSPEEPDAGKPHVRICEGGAG